MSRTEYLSIAGLRVDGRRPHEVRRLKCKFGLFSKVDGSAFFEQGNTKVIAVVYGPREVRRRSNMNPDKAVIECDYSIAPFATSERKKQRAFDKRSIEISLAVKQTFEAAVMVNLFPRSQIDIFLRVVQSDGGLLPACINAANLALMDAGIAMKDFVVACSTGHIQRNILTDLNYVEASSGGAELPVALMPRKGEIVMMQMTNKVSIEIFEEMMEAAKAACNQIFELLQPAVRENALKLLDSRSMSSVPSKTDGSGS